jgi:hypothetical protein
LNLATRFEIFTVVMVSYYAVSMVIYSLHDSSISSINRKILKFIRILSTLKNVNLGVQYAYS